MYSVSWVFGCDFFLMFPTFWGVFQGTSVMHIIVWPMRRIELSHRIFVQHGKAGNKVKRENTEFDRRDLSCLCVCVLCCVVLCCVVLWCVVVWCSVVQHKLTWIARTHSHTSINTVTMTLCKTPPQLLVLHNLASNCCVRTNPTVGNKSKVNEHKAYSEQFKRPGQSAEHLTKDVTAFLSLKAVSAIGTLISSIVLLQPVISPWAV